MEEKSNEIKAVPKLLDLLGVNKLHWMLDIVFREDKCRVRAGNVVLNMNFLRKMVLHRLKKMKMGEKQVSAERRMMHTTLNSDFLYKALFSK
jgi:predicted transposase YbfD/YdcC